MRNAIGYTPKPQTYTQENIQQDLIPPQKSEDEEKSKKTEETQEKEENFNSGDDKNEDLNEDVILDPIKLMKIAVSLEQKPWQKPLDNNLIE